VIRHFTTVFFTAAFFSATVLLLIVARWKTFASSVVRWTFPSQSDLIVVSHSYNHLLIPCTDRAGLGDMSFAPSLYLSDFTPLRFDTRGTLWSTMLSTNSFR
jgi:hypothetical protein